MAEPVRHRRTKGAVTDMFEPKATASHLELYTSRHFAALRNLVAIGHSALWQTVRSADLWVHGLDKVKVALVQQQLGGRDVLKGDCVMRGIGNHRVARCIIVGRRQDRIDVRKYGLAELKGV